MNDAAGREVKVGDFVVYTTCSGSSSASLRWARVVGVHRLNLSVVATKSWNSDMLQKVCTIGNWYSISVITRDQVPPEALKSLDTVEVPSGN